MKKEIRVYEGWKDISLGKMKGLEKIGEENKGLNEFELSCLYISYLYECEAKDLNFKEFQAYAQSLTFLGEPIPETKLKLEYNINGKEYSLDINPASFTAGQYYDFSQYNLKEKKDLIDFLSVILIPKGHTYCDDYNIEDVKEELLSLPMPDVNAIVNFYIALVKRLAQLSQTFSLRLIKKAKKKMTKEEYEGLKKEIKTLYQTLQSFPLS